LEVEIKKLKEQTVSFTLDLETVRHQRSKFKVLDDRDIR